MQQTLSGFSSREISQVHELWSLGKLELLKLNKPTIETLKKVQSVIGKYKESENHLKNKSNLHCRKTQFTSYYF